MYEMYTFSFFELYNVKWRIFCLHDVPSKNVKRQINNDQGRQKKPFDQSITNSIIFRRHIENGKPVCVFVLPNPAGINENN